MAKKILITVSLANDMLAPISKHQTPPNDLHIGFYETNRILGTDWTNGPLMAFLKSSYADKDLAVINIRDWHDPKDPTQKEELEKYGPHCIKNTWGAEFIWENKKILPKKSNEYIINSKKLLTVSEKEFTQVFDKIIGNTPKEDIKIGIIGVLTNIKVFQMAVELQGFYGINNISVCSALTASTNIRKHFQAIDDLSNIYGIQIADSIKLFSDWLKVRRKEEVKISKFDSPKIINKMKASLTKEEEKIIGYLYRGCKNVNLKKLNGGYSPASVFLVNSIDRQGFEQTPTVLKLDKMENIGKERVGFEKMQQIMGSHMPQIIDSIEMESGAGIRYSFAMMHKSSIVKTFKEFFMSLNGSKKQDIDELAKCIKLLFGDILGSIYRNWTLEQKQLWKSNTFKPEYLGYIASSIKKVLGYTSYEKRITLKGIGEFYNPLKFYTEENISSKLKQPIAYVRQSLIHGDLNAANILLDEKMNIWLIDFFHSDYDNHIIQDIVKLENDLKFIHTPIKNEKDLNQMAKFEKLLMEQQKLSAPLKSLPSELNKNPNIKRLYCAVKMLREFAFNLSEDNSMEHYRIPQLRYSGHNLSFPESNDLQKKYALISTALLCEYFDKK